jgi:uncharacterized protein YqiB (DUF1249 family)
MTRKKQETSAKGKSASTHRWADEIIAITENAKQKGIEIRFNAEPSPQLQPKLRAMGFRHSKMKTMWYGDNTPEALEFAEKVKTALPVSTDGPELFLSPSVEAVRTNIENREFSFVMITLKDGQVKNYIIFESSKPKAEVIATNFAHQEFGDKFLSLAALPKTHIKEARTLFDEGKIIFPEGQKVPTHKGSVIKGLKPVSEPVTDEITETGEDKQRETERLALQKFYQWATLQPNFSSKPSNVNRELFDNWFKENYPDLSVKAVESMWQSHNRITKSLDRLEKRSTGKPLMQPYSSIYKKLMQVIPDLINHIEEGKHHGKSVKEPKGGLMDLNFDYLGKDKKGNYLIALSHYFEQNGDMIADPDMQIRILPDLEAAEAMTFQDQFGYQEVYPDKGDGKEYVDLRRKKDLNQFLSQWLTNIIRQGHKIDLTKVKSEPEETPDYFYRAYEQLIEFIPDLLTYLKKGKQEGEFSVEEEGTLRRISYTLTPRQDNETYNIWLNEFIDEREKLQSDIEIEPIKKKAYVTAEWLSHYYAGKYDREESEDEIDERDGDISEEMTRGLTEWLDDVLKLGYRIHLNKPSQGKKKLSAIETENANSATDFERLHTSEEERQIIAQFITQGFTRPFSAQEAFDKNLPVIDLAFRYVGSMEYFRDHIENPRKKKIQELREELKYLKGEKGVNEKRNSLKEQIEQLEAEMTFAEKLVQDESLIFQDDLIALILQKGKQRGYAKEITEDISSFGDYFVTNILDNRAIENYHKDPVQTVVNELIDEYFNLKEESNAPEMKSEQSDTSKSVATDLKSGDTFVPNVLVPSDTTEPFHSQLFQIYDMTEVIKNNFPHLLKITNENLSNASPIAMFELMQFGHPSEHGVDVNRIDLLKEWENRGKSIFKEIGFPTDNSYPYVNLHLGYESIEPLKEMLFDNNKEGDEWWAIAEHARPIADVKKALKIIDQMIEKEKREMKTYLNPKNGKPKLEYKHLVRDAELTIENLEDSKEVLQHYVDNPPEAEKENTEETSQDPLANESGVYTAKTAGENFEEIEIPIPKGAQFEARISIVKTSNGDYKIRLHAAKKFGDHEGLAFPASVDGQSYSTKEEALKYGLNFLELRLGVLLTAKDTILGNEEKKKKQLNMALDALKKFANENDIAPKNNPIAASAKAPLKNTGITKGLEATYWKKEDNKYPQDKAVINGMEFDQARLREAIQTKLEKLPIETLEEIAQELSLKFKERRPLATYEKSLVTIGKTGDKRKATLIASYVDDLIVDNDLTDKANSPVMTFLVELLFSNEQKLIDFPMEETGKKENKKNSLRQKQSQYELNKEIEAFIEKKDKEGSSFNEEEKNYIRQYTGSGGLIKEGATGRGVLYEYYTPDEVAKKMWGLAYKYGYDGGSVLEPSVGTDNFLKYAPKDAIVFGFETNHFSARIAQILFPNAHIHEKAFESLFFAGNIHLKDDFDHPLYSLVIGNPPYGDFTGKYAGMGEKQWTGATEYDQYFILRGLDLLKKGGLLVFVVPSSFLSYNVKSAKVKEKVASKIDFMDAYRLPIRTFETTDIGTDILLLRKK